MTETTAGVGVQDEPPGWLTEPTPLSPKESSHWQDFKEDFRADQCGGRGACRACLFGIPYGCFYHGLERILLCCSDAASPFLFPPPPKQDRIPNLEKRTELFDGLANHYGDAYRGSAVFNYLLGVVAVIFALTTSLVNPPWRWVPALIEVIALVLIAVTYMRGRARSEHDESPGGPRRFSQRWHERWLDYRGLAEAFRYAELQTLSPRHRDQTPEVESRPDEAQAESPQRYLQGRPIQAAGESDDGSIEDWCMRYFRSELEATPWPPPRDAIYYAHFLRAALDEQQRYHHKNAHETKTLTQQLHALTAAVFMVGVLAAVAELGPHMGVTWIFFTDGPPPFWIFLTAGLPMLAASLHGIHGACEWKKMARSSKDMEHALTEMRLDIEKLLTTGTGFTGERRESLYRLVTRFIHVTTDEASGWRAALWDKNVPLGG